MILGPGQRDLLEPLPELLTEGLHAYEQNAPQAALELFRQAIEKAKSVGEF
jgi:hypothetical protein